MMTMLSDSNQSSKQRNLLERALQSKPWYRNSGGLSKRGLPVNALIVSRNHPKFL